MTSVCGGRLAGALALALVLSACQGPAPAPPAAPGPTLSSQAAAALDRGDYAAAADLFRKALAGAPENVGLHYGLGVAASHLNLRSEAIAEFKWVLARGPKGSSEVEGARRWLTSAGALDTAEATDTSAPDARPEPGQASLEGQVVMPEGGGSNQRRMLVLYGLPNTATKEERRQVRTDDSGRFRFPNLPPGPYMLTDAVSGPRTWRLRVELQPSQAATLDLTPANIIKVKDDFPNQG